MSGIWSDWLTYHDRLLGGLWTSLRLTFMTLLLGLPAGLLLAIAVSSPRHPLRRAAIVIVEIGRGTPALVLLQIVYNGIPVEMKPEYLDRVVPSYFTVVSGG